MHKKGQGQHIFGWIFAYIILGVIFIFGIYGIIKLVGWQDYSKMNVFIDEIKNDLKTVNDGDINSFRYELPKDTGRIFLTDQSNPEKKDALKKFLLEDKLPTINEMVQGTNANIFITTEKTMNAPLYFHTGKLSLDYPYFLCFKPMNGELKFLAQGIADSVRIYPDPKLEMCDFGVEPLTDKLDTFLNAICGKDDYNCQTAEKQAIDNAKESVQLKVKLNPCKPDLTEIEYTLTPLQGIGKFGKARFK